MNAASTYAPRRAARVVRHPLRGVNYAVHEWGERDAPLLIYLHGWGDTGATFQFAVDQLQHEWHVVAPDWRGFGRSDHDSGGYWFPNYLADLDALLDVYCPNEPVTLVGHSMGGNVAALYAGVFPQRVDALVNIEGFGLAGRPAADAPQHFGRFIRADKKGARYATYRSLDELVPRILARSPSLEKTHARFIADQWATTGDDGVVRLRADARHKLPNAVLYRRAEAEACWQAINARVLLLVGGDSGQYEPALAFQSMLASCTSAPRLTQIDGVGQMVHFEAPAALAQHIESFVRQSV